MHQTKQQHTPAAVWNARHWVRLCLRVIFSIHNFVFVWWDLCQYKSINHPKWFYPRFNVMNYDSCHDKLWRLAMTPPHTSATNECDSRLFSRLPLLFALEIRIVRTMQMENPLKISAAFVSASLPHKPLFLPLLCTYLFSLKCHSLLQVFV